MEELLAAVESSRVEREGIGGGAKSHYRCGRAGGSAVDVVELMKVF